MTMTMPLMVPPVPSDLLGRIVLPVRSSAANCSDSCRYERVAVHVRVLQQQRRRPLVHRASVDDVHGSDQPDRASDRDHRAVSAAGRNRVGRRRRRYRLTMTGPGRGQVHLRAHYPETGAAIHQVHQCRRVRVPVVAVVRLVPAAGRIRVPPMLPLRLHDSRSVPMRVVAVPSPLDPVGVHPLVDAVVHVRLVRLQVVASMVHGMSDTPLIGARSTAGGTIDGNNDYMAASLRLAPCRHDRCYIRHRRFVAPRVSHPGIVN